MRRPVAAALLWGLAIGAAFHVYWYGTGGLDPTNVEWMSRSDPATFFLGWHFFRFEPWTFPLGLVRNYGEGMGTSVIVTDSLPALAIALKPFSAWLPERFQYFGLWLLACLVLNAATAFALVGRFTESLSARVVGAALFTTAPFLVWRGVYHMSLVAHWQMLLGVLLYLTPARRGTWIAWAALLAFSGLTTAYLFAIVGAVWTAALVKAAWADSPRAPPLSVLRIAVATIAFCALVFWIAGMFSIAGHAGSGGYGYNQLDLLGFFDSRGATRLHPGFTRGPRDSMEDYQYMGLGASLAVALALLLWCLRPSRPPRTLVPLIVVALLLFAFAVSHRITFAGRVLYELPVPQSFLDAAAILRSSARMGWLPAYLLLAWAVVTLARRLPRPVVPVVMVGLLYVNGVDASTDRPRFDTVMRYRPPPIVAEQSAFVASLPQGYRHLEWVPRFHLFMDSIHDVWGYAVAAAPRGISINLAYVARVDAQAFAREQRRAIDTALQGPLDPATVYITRNPALAASMQRVGGAGAAFGRLGDDHIVVPRGGAGASFAGLRHEPAAAAPSAAVFDARFTSPSPGLSFLATGWSQPHGYGTWSDGDEATLLIPAPAGIASGGGGKLQVYGLAYSHRGPQTIDTIVNGVQVARWRMEPSSVPQWQEATLPPGLARPDGMLRIAFRIGDPQRPAEAPKPQWNDRRRLGLLLVLMRIE